MGIDLRRRGVMSVGAVWSGPVAAEIDAGNRFCLSLSSTLDNGELAIVNLTPVLPSAPGDGQLVSSDVVVPPAASNVNFRPDVVDPNLAFVPVGSDGFACFGTVCTPMSTWSPTASPGSPPSRSARIRVMAVRAGGRCGRGWRVIVWCRVSVGVSVCRVCRVMWRW
ncbi:MAG: hypothetical protein R2697_12800 [Ilumatobacteraceae bacterium]